MKVIYRTPTVMSLGGREGTVRSADGCLDLEVAYPIEMGGPGGKTNPEELFAAGYAACFHSAIKRTAGDKKIAIGKSIVEAHVSAGQMEESVGFRLAVELHVILPAAEIEQAKEVVRGAHLICPYSNATRNNIDVILSVAPVDHQTYYVT